MTSKAIPPVTLERTEQAKVMFKPLRIEMLRLLAEPRTCPQLAAELEITMQRAWYHVKVLQRTGVVERVGERQVRGFREGIYQVKAAGLALAPMLMAELGIPAAPSMPGATGHADPVQFKATIELAPVKLGSLVEKLQLAFREVVRELGTTTENAWEAETFTLAVSLVRDL